MASVKKINLAGEPIGTFEIPEELRDYQCTEGLVHTCIVAHLANRRQGTASTLTKGEVSYSGKKPWRQKGTGQARSGYKASPIWRGGGVVFGPKPRSYHQKVNRKSRRKALFGIIAGKIREGAVQVVDAWTMESPRTKTMSGFKTTLAARKLVCIGMLDNRNAYLSARNVTGIQFLDIDSINVYDLLNATQLVISEAAFSVVEERFQTVKQYSGTK